jgi:hypothetical protein
MLDASDNREEWILHREDEQCPCIHSSARIIPVFVSGGAVLKLSDFLRMNFSDIELYSPGERVIYGGARVERVTCV